jgi:hypothetical protein
MSNLTTTQTAGSTTNITGAADSNFCSPLLRCSTLDLLQSYHSPSSEDETGNQSFIRCPTVPPGTVQSTGTTLTAEQFQHLLLNITESIKSTHTTVPPKEDNPFAVAWAEFYISQGLACKFDGTQDKLAPWIKKFKALRGKAL